MCITIVLENQNGTLDYFDFNLDNEFNEARAFYFDYKDEIFEIRKDYNNGYYDIVDEKIFYRKS